MTPLRSAPEPAGPLYRVGRLPDPLVWPAWAYMGGGRFDDPRRVFRTLYAAEGRLACFVELLAAFRTSPQALALLRAVENTDEPLVVGIVPAEWLRKRCIRAFRLSPGQRWLDLRAFETREALRTELAGELARLGLDDLDVSGIRGPWRELTQSVARWAYEHGFAGLAYRSRFDDSLDCWAIFEGAEFESVGVGEPLTPADHDLVQAAALFGLRLEP